MEWLMIGRAGIALVVASLASGASVARPSESAPVIAITFDDLPAHGALPPGQTREGIIRAIAATLKAERVPAFGFLNGGVERDDPDAARAIAAWRRAGLPIGNHGYTHANLDTVGAAAFTTDIVTNEAPLIAAMGTRADWHWFRYPFLAEGRSPAAQNQIRATLRDRGYRIAAVTMGFADYAWNAPYAACLAKGNRAAVAQLEQGFLNDARTAALASRANATAQVGRDIPYVLLMHVGALDARMLPRLIALYRSMGFRFTTLARAQADPFYAGAMDLSRPGPSPALANQPQLTGPPADLCG
ncbi:polysaccharide deacetylase family protein [Sphingomonas sp. BT553]|uniref:Chitooligosaccharide deacetylase n=2 Tax=Sphingomonas mollis TaxID=2795726 RepID=A0ABS0XQE8_9SPHN|nr:polysaccharide deacetylase family protein [Sphingomonas sp. BT553]